MICRPFTIQRICELLLMLDQFTVSDSPVSRQYSNFEKYLHALYKVLMQVCNQFNMLILYLVSQCYWKM